MALKIEFKGYVNDIRSFDWGTVIVVAHDQRQLVDGEWQSVGKDYIDVSFEGTPPEKNTLVFVKGNLKVGTYAKRDGSTGVSLKVRAEEITLVGRESAPQDLPF
jgi:hypothetical protein